MAAGIAKAVILAPRRAGLRKTIRTLRRYPLLPLALLLLVLVSGIGADWIAPHDPENAGDLSDRVQPPFWGAATTREKVVVEKVGIGRRFQEIDLEEARAVKEDAVLGRQVGRSNQAGRYHQIPAGHRPLGPRHVKSAHLWRPHLSDNCGGDSGGRRHCRHCRWLDVRLVRRLVDELVMRTVDVFLSVPLILVTLVLSGGIRPVP